jgi:hypothetical protein
MSKRFHTDLHAIDDKYNKRSHALLVEHAMSSRSITRTVIALLLMSLALPAVAPASDTNGDGLELILIPLDLGPVLEREGLYGSRWRGEIYVHNASQSDVSLLGLSGCGPVGCLLQVFGQSTILLPGPQYGSMPDRGALFSAVSGNSDA